MQKIIVQKTKPSLFYSLGFISSFSLLLVVLAGKIATDGPSRFFVYLSLFSFLFIVLFQYFYFDRRRMVPHDLAKLCICAFAPSIFLTFAWMFTFNPLQSADIIFDEPELNYLSPKITAAHKKLEGVKINQMCNSLPSQSLTSFEKSLPNSHGSIMAAYGLPTFYRVQYYPFVADCMKSLSKPEINDLNGFAHIMKGENDSIKRRNDVVFIGPDRFN